MGKLRTPFALMALALWGCSQLAGGDVTPRPVVKMDEPPPDTVEVRVGVGDVLEISSYTESLPSGEFPITKQGTIVYPYLGVLKVVGMTPSEIQQTIIRGLRDGYFRNPVISVTIKKLESKRITVFGAVKKPGIFPYSRAMTLLEVLSLAGGITDRADSDSITLIRRHDKEEYRIRIALGDILNGTKPNIWIRPGDVIFVPKKVF